MKNRKKLEGNIFERIYKVVRKISSRANIELFRRYYETFIVIIILFLFYIYLLTFFWNTGMRFDIVRFLAPAFAILFFYCGILMENSKRNWFIGIRTPWTMSDDKVWEKTHNIGGKLFKISGIISLGGILSPRLAIFFIIFPVILFTIYTFIYSYFEFKKIKT